MPPKIDLTGMHFGRLTVIGRGEDAKDGHHRWKCICDCGAIKEKPVTTYALTHGKTISCGCYFKDVMPIINARHKTTHGMSKSRLFTIWKDMRARCNNPNDISYCRYGAKGISVCEEWNEFECFMRWALANGYKDNLSIDRIDNSKGYYPENCKWSTSIEQCNNRKNNRIVSYNGESYTLAELARKLHINPATLRDRINKGLSVSDLAKKPERRKMKCR